MTFKGGHRHASRFQAIVRVLASHGFGYLLGQLGLKEHMLSRWWRARYGPNDMQSLLTRGERARKVLEELGPTFVKMGQMLSVRRDLVPEDIRLELAKLQDQSSPFPFSQAQSIIEDELGRPIAEIFRWFDPEPLAAASIGQVHRALLQNGDEVVVKVQRPGIDKVITVDLEILHAIAQIAEKRTAWGKHYRVVELVEEFRNTLLKEMDYVKEGENAEVFLKNFAKNDKIYIPRVYWEYSSLKVHTMEYVAGIKLGETNRLKQAGLNLKQIVQDLAKAIFHQIFIDGFFHADPHPGNISVLPGERIVLMDFGMAGRLTPENQRQLVNLIMGLVNRNSKQILRAMLEMGVVNREVDLDSLYWDIDRLRKRYYDTPLSQVKLGQAIREILDLAFLYRIRIPTEHILVAKALIVLEGIIEELAPDLSIVDVAEPFGRRLMRERLKPRRLWQEIREQIWEFNDIFLRLPKRIDQTLAKVEDGRLIVKLEHAELHHALYRLDRISNRLSFSIMLLAFSTVIVGLLLASVLAANAENGVLWFRLPVLEAGFVLTLLMGAWLLLAIYRSGRL
jgi:ubiquinone biosynthesis protein